MAGKMNSPPPYSDYNQLMYGQDGHPTPSAGFPQQSGQQQVIVVQQPMAPTFVYHPHPVSMTGAIVLSCCVFWCFGLLFGAIAFILAMIGSDSSQSGDIAGALRLRNASYGVSVAGIVISIVVVIIIVSLSVKS